ncbi:nitrilase-related carbon-nitrogen hydrolase [Legionella brunensis]|uniref:nitrilase-related carbon-nitrogen hydrolase n=1 Tax=Legionella brunensis TaxID=29422 RepID=UPI00138ECD39|nr:nitrilase-related carbon-nitrogen hydrolase [Legionella brunensis]
MDSDTNQGKKYNPAVPSGMRVFIFQPDENFYMSPFDKRLKLLEEQIIFAKKSLLEIKEDNHLGSNVAIKSSLFWIKNKLGTSKRKFDTENSPEQQPAPPSAIFVAPEYLFKDFSKLSYERYYTQAQKNAFKSLLAELSRDTDMLIVPGTICWHKNAKLDQSTYYRNTAYFFYHGDIQKYKKRYPHTNYDFDYVDEGFLNLMDLRRMSFKTGDNDSLVKDYFGLRVGIEICYDSVQKSLSNYVKKNNTSLHIQLVIADGAKKSVFVNRDGVFFIKIEKNKHETQLGTIKVKVKEETELEPAILLSCTEELSCFQLKT